MFPNHYAVGIKDYVGKADQPSDLHWDVPNDGVEIVDVFAADFDGSVVVETILVGMAVNAVDTYTEKRKMGHLNSPVALGLRKMVQVKVPHDGDTY